MIEPGSPEFPAAKDDDDDDVAWALSTAHVQWKRGSQADAIVWLRRAIDSAVSVGATWRAAELTRQTDALEADWLNGSASARAESYVSIDDFDGTDMIGDDVLSLPPDAELDEPAPAAAEALDDEIVEISEDEIVEDDDEISENDLGDGPTNAVGRSPFESEAPTAEMVDPRQRVRAADDDPTAPRFHLSFADVAALTAAPVSEPEPEPEPAPISVLSEPFVVGISLAEIRGFEDFPPETQLQLARAARVERLATEDEVSGFGLALVLRGAVNVMPTIADVGCGAAGERELIYGRGTLTEGVALRLVATAPDTQIAVWGFDVITPPLEACPWVLEELQAVADRYQALAGVSMGPMGERLDDSLRGMVLSRCRLVRLLPGEVLVEKGKPVGGLFIVGAGKLELGSDPESPGSEGELLPGDFLFAPQVLAAGSAPTAARAGASGALLMAADRHAAHELMLSVPPLLELLAG